MDRNTIQPIGAQGPTGARGLWSSSSAWDNDFKHFQQETDTLLAHN